jgi:uncharacterized protein (TIGR02444 family)
MSGETLTQFALRVYADPDVSEACLRLQDEHGADVNLLLFACWLTARGTAFPAEAETRLRDWRASVIAPLRGIRRNLKPVAATWESVAQLREKVKQAELEAEMIALAMLEELAAHQVEHPDSRARPALRIANLRAAAGSGASIDGAATRLVADLCSAIERAG